jgi:hypothetical protein
MKSALRFILPTILCGSLAAMASSQSTALKYGDGQADGKQSIGGSGEMIEFALPRESPRVGGLRIHGSRYGMPEAPDESFLIFFLSQDRKSILHTEMAPYSHFDRGSEKWVTISFSRPVELPDHFWVVLDFRASARKGVYVSYDTSSGGKHSRTGLPGTPALETKFGGDWMIELLPAKREAVR